MGNRKSRATSPAYADLLPPKYEFQTKLDEGCYGAVLKCLDTDTRNVVAVKIPKFRQHSKEEVSILRRLMNLDHCNIVKFYDCFPTKLGQALVFEHLHMSLYDYLVDRCGTPMLLYDVRIITTQLATALVALKSIGVIHADIKPDNVMLVNPIRPFQVKLIDFGLAIERFQAKPGMILQPISMRSPEILLGLPFAEAIDMWSVGQMVFIMFYDEVLISARTTYEAMHLVVRLLGLPPDDLLNRGIYTHMYFTKTESNTWRIKTLEEYKGKAITLRSRAFSTLDDLKKKDQEKGNEAYAEQHDQCIELLKAMLTMDASERITPLQVLRHPFITQDDHQDHQDQIQVRPATPENTLQLEDVETSDSLKAEPDETFMVLSDVSPDTPVMASEDRKDEQQKETTTTASTPPPPPPKKKKNVCQRFRSWMKRTFRCNRVGVVGGEEGNK